MHHRRALHLISPHFALLLSTLLLSTLLLLTPTVHASVTVLTPAAVAAASAAAISASTGTAALPALPSPTVGTLALSFDPAASPAPANGGAGVQSQNQTFLSIPQKGNFLGISLELSVIDKLVGSSAAQLNVPFLNYVAAIRTRAGMGPIIRVGGNTQDTAVYNTSQTVMITKKQLPFTSGQTPTTPDVVYSPLLFQALANVSSLLDVDFIFGMNMVDIGASFTPDAARDIEQALGDHLHMLLVGNEPDRYSLTGNRNSTYSIPDYMDEWGQLTSKMAAVMTRKNLFVAPSVCCYWDTFNVTVTNGFQQRFQSSLAAVSVIKYPQSLCGNPTPYGLDGYLRHSYVTSFTTMNAAAAAAAQAAGLPFIITETNTMSCVGTPGVADVFASAIWAIDAAMSLAYNNHTGMLLHSSGQNTVYNLFTPPPHNETGRGWQTGPVLYATLVVAEALGSSNTSQVRDLFVNNDNVAAYAIYENGTPQRALLLNMVNDPSGANTLTANLPSNGATSVQVKYLLAPTVSEKANITWAGQTFGLYSEGVLHGTEAVQTVSCNGDTCPITVPAPGVALVFLTTQSESKVHVPTSTFALAGTDIPSVVANSNGNRGGRGGATSHGSSGASTAVRVGAATTMLAILAGVIFVAARAP